MKGKDLLRLSYVILILSFLAVSLVYAIPTEPTGPQRITRISDSRYNTSSWPPVQIQAEAGNVTRLEISSLTQTQTWQGYYGDIYGTITLDDAFNYTMYDWYMAEPQGEIYAASAIITNWDTVHCLDYNNNGSYLNYSYDGGTKWTVTNNSLNLSELESGSLGWSLGLSSGDYDGVDETFNESGTIIIRKTALGNTYENHTGFFVGTINISAGSCPASKTYETNCVNTTDPDEYDQYAVDIFANGTYPDVGNLSICDVYAVNPAQMDNESIWSGANYTGQTFHWKSSIDKNNYQEVLLTVNNSKTIIYTTIIENRRQDNETDPLGFNNRTNDFQILVGDVGHPGPGQDSPTAYYFYVELE